MERGRLRAAPAMAILLLVSSSLLGLLGGAEQLRFQEAFPGSGGAVNWSPDGTRLATASGNNTLILNSTDGSRLMRLQGHMSTVSSVKWSPDGSIIASGGADRTVRLWSAQDGTSLINLSCQEPVSSVAWSPNGTAVGAAHGNVLTVWDAASGCRTAELEENTTLRVVAWSPDGGRLAAAGSRGFAQIYDTASWTRLFRLSGLTGEVRSLAWAPEGLLLATGDEKSIKVWDGATGAMARSLFSNGDPRFRHPVAWSPDGRYLAASFPTVETVRTSLWNTSSWKVSQTLTWPAEFLAFSPDGNRLAIVMGGTITICGVSGGLLLRDLSGHDAGILSLSWSPDGTRLATGSADSTVRTWAVMDGEELMTFRGHDGPVRSVGWSPDGSRIASASDNGTVLVWDPDSLAMVSYLNGSHPLAWSPDGRALASSGRGGATVRLWDPQNALLLKELMAPAGTVFALAWSPDGTRLAASSYDPSSGSCVRIWDTAEGTPVADIPQIGRAEASPIAWSPDGRRLAVPMSGYNISLISADDWTVVGGLGNIPYARNLAWSPDGSKLAFSLLFEILLWDPATPYPYVTVGRPLEGKGAVIDAMAWSPVETVLASGCEDGRLIVYGPLGDLPSLNVVLSATTERLWAGESLALTITIKDDSGAPVEGASLRLASAGGLLSAAGEAGNGTYRANFLAPEVGFNSNVTVAVLAAKEGFLPAGSALRIALVANRAPVLLGMNIANGSVFNATGPLEFTANANDPDGDTLYYSWREDGRDLAASPSFSGRFPAGEHTVVLEVGDGHARATGSVTFTINPAPPAEQAPAAVPLPVAGAAAAATTVICLAAALAFSAEPGKYRLLTLLLVPLYSRINRESALDHETRGMIRGAIIADPGIHYSELIRRLDLRNGTAAYHLQTLEREGLIKSRSDGRFRRFYPSEMKFIGSHVRPTKLQRIILETVQEKEGMSQIEIAKTLDISYAIVHREVKRMSLIGMVRLHRHGISVKCFIAEEWQERLRQEKAELAKLPARDLDAADG